jgi:hypothetical protein
MPPSSQGPARICRPSRPTREEPRTSPNPQAQAAGQSNVCLLVYIDIMRRILRALQRGWSAFYKTKAGGVGEVNLRTEGAGVMPVSTLREARKQLGFNKPAISVEPAETTKFRPNTHWTTEMQRKLEAMGERALERALRRAHLEQEH